MTTANKVTILRILLTPFFVGAALYYVRSGLQVYRLLALLCFGVASICDGVDGYIARRFNQRSELGAILDPLADKLLLVSGIVLLSFDHAKYLPSIPLWMTITVLGRDLLLLIGLGVIHLMVGKVIVHPRVTGKIATVLQMIAILWCLLDWEQRWLLGWALGATICTGLSGLLYLWDGMRQLSAHPSSSPSVNSSTPIQKPNLNNPTANG